MVTRPSWKKKTAMLLCFCRLDFTLHDLLLQCSGCVESKNGVDSVKCAARSSDHVS